MAVVADRVIVDLEARLDKYEANVRRAEQKFDTATKSISRSAKDMEKQIERSSEGVGAQFRKMAGTLAAAFTVNQVREYADGYTRFTNQLKVAGVAGENLGRTQNNLFNIAQKYGVQLESVGTLYSRATQASTALGASQADLLKFTNGVAAALKVQGGSASETQGALLQLSQLLGTGTVRAEEFNSVNEGARPILQAVAQGIDKYKGSVSALRNDVIAGKVTSQEFFQAFLRGSAALETQAAKANLTIGASFTILNNAIGKFIGESDQSLSATQRVSAAIIALSENLGTVTNALGVLAAILGGRYIAGLVAGAAATGLTSAAIFAMQARAVGAATTMEALAFVSTEAGGAMLAAFGGPVGLAVAALAVGIYYLTQRANEAATATGIYAQQTAVLHAIQERSAAVLDKLATATGKARTEALANAQALRAETIQYLANARAALAAAQAKAVQARQNVAESLSRADPRTSSGFAIALANSGGSMAGGGIGLPTPDVVATTAADRTAQANVRAANKNVADAKKEADRIEAAIRAPAFVPPPVAAPKTKKGPKTPKGPKAADPDEVAARFADDLARGQAEYTAAQAELIGTEKARRDAQIADIRADEDQRARRIIADKELNQAQKDKLLELNKQTAAARVDSVRAADLRGDDEDARALRLADLSNQREKLQAQAELATTVGERRDLELQILELSYQEERQRQQAIADNARLSDAEREVARRRIAAMDVTQPYAREQVNRRNEGAGASFAREINGKDINEELDKVRVRGLQALEDKLVDVTSKIFKMGGVFGDVANQIIADLIRIGVERAVIGPLADLLFGKGSGGSSGGGIGGAVASIAGALFGGKTGTGSVIKGRASGGHVVAGQIYQVNEGGGIEGFQPAGSGKIIPLGQMNRAQAAAPGGGGAPVFNVSVSAPGANAHTVALIRQTLADAAPTLVQAASRATMRNIGRKRMT